MVTSLPVARDPRLADGEDEVVELRHLEALAVEDLVLEEHDGSRIADRRLQEALGVGCGVRRDHLQPRHMRIPGGVILAVLRGDARGGAIGSPEHDGAMHLAARHIERLGGGIDDVVDRLHGEVPGHELDDGLEAGEGRADAHPGKAIFGDRRVDHAGRAELVEQALGHFVGALIFADLLAHDEHRRIAAHLFRHGVAQRLAHGHADHLGTRRDLGLGARLGSARLAGPPAPSRHREGSRRVRGALLGPHPSRRALERPPQGEDALPHPEGRPQAASRRMRPLTSSSPSIEQEARWGGSPSHARCPRPPGSCRACRPRRLPPPWSPCRSRSRR